MKVGRFAMQFGYSMIGVLVLMSASPSPALAQDHDSHMLAAAHQDQTPQQKKQIGALVKAVRRATAQFQHPEDAGPDFVLQFGCVSGGDFGAMGLHFVNGKRVDGKIDVNSPEILLYEPLPNGRLQLTGADYLVTKEAWEADPKHTAPPELMGQLFHLFDSPNRFGLPAFYTLHVWAWKENPAGTFTNWNPNVSCDAFNEPND
jgi:hypothetical protein